MRFLLLLLLAFDAGAETFYVRSVDQEYGAEDGTSYLTAFDGFADVTWAAVDTAGSVDAGDTLIVCGTFAANSADGGAATMITVSEAGAAGEPIVIDGDCSAQGAPAKAIIDPNSSATVTRGIHTLTNANITLKNMLVRNIAGTSISVGLALGTSAAEVATAKNIIVDNVDVQNVEGSAADQTTKKCITGFGGNIEIKNSDIADCWDDAIQITGANANVHDNNISEVSQGTTDGDCVQLTGNTTGPSTGSAARDNVCDHSDKDTKQCFIMGDAADTPIRYVEDNVCLMPVGATVANGVLITSGTATVARNYVRGGNVGVRANSGTRVDFISNVLDQQSAKGAYAGSSVTAANFLHNTAANTGGNGAAGTACFSSDVNTNVHIFRNNICAGSTGAGIDRQGTTAIEDHNLVYDATTPASINCATADCAAATTDLAATDVAADPQFMGGDNPTAAEGFRLKAGSPAKRVGVVVGPYHDHLNRRFSEPPNIGAFTTGSGDPATRSAAAARTAAASRTAATNRTAR